MRGISTSLRQGVQQNSSEMHAFMHLPTDSTNYGQSSTNRKIYISR